MKIVLHDFGINFFFTCGKGIFFCLLLLLQQSSNNEQKELTVTAAPFICCFGQFLGWLI